MSGDVENESINIRNYFLKVNKFCDYKSIKIRLLALKAFY